MPAHAPEAPARASVNDSDSGNTSLRQLESYARWQCRAFEMTDGPINLDGRRPAAQQRETEMRRRPANSQTAATTSPQPHLGSLEDQMLAEPARTWAEAMSKCRFLLDLYATTPEAGDERIQKLINRALGDMERLKKREERQ